MAKHGLSIQVEPEGGITTVVLEGAVDAATAADFQATMERVCAVPGAKVFLDCRGLSYLNSASFGFLKQFHRLCEDNDGVLAIYGLWDKIAELLELVGLDPYLNIYRDREEALRAIDEPA